MDKLDWKILETLDWNGRIPINRLAKKVGSNKDVVGYRIKKFEEKKIISRYYPVLDMYKLGYNTSRFYFDLEEMNEETEKEFIEFLDKEMNAGLIFRMDYPYRYGIFVWTKSIQDVENTIKKIKNKLGKYLIRYNYTIICTFRQYPKDYMFEKAQHNEYRSLEPTEKINFDERDFLILKELANNARASTLGDLQNLDMPQTTVSSKIKSMGKKEIILGYRAEINFVKLGYMNFFIEIYLDDNSNLSEIESWANINPNVVWLQKIVGTCDMELEVEVKNRVELEKLLNEMRNKFPTIRKLTFWSQEYRKLTFLP